MNEPNRQESLKNCAIYARAVRSTKESIEAQIDACLADVRHHGWTIADHHVFCDEGRNRYMAFDERPGLKALLDAAKSEAHPFKIVIVDANYRFSRSFSEMLSVYSALSRAGVAVHVSGTTIGINDLETAVPLVYGSAVVQTSGR